MARAIHQNRSWRFLTAAIALFPLTAWAQQESPITWIKGDNGPFGLYAAEGTWAQRIVTIRNSGTEDRRVELSFPADLRARGEQLFSRVFVIPGQSERLVDLAIRPGYMKQFNPEGRDANLTTSEFDRLEERYVLRDADTGQKLQGASGPAMRAWTERTNIGLIQGDMDPRESYFYLKKLETGALGDSQLLASSPHNYATRWYGYSMVSILVVTDPEIARIRPCQMQALEDWVRRGGVLVLAGSKRLAEALRGEMGELAGVGSLAVHEVLRAKITGVLPGERPLEFEFPYPLPMVELMPVTAEVVHEMNGLPFLTRQARGDGWVYTLAMPVVSLQDKAVQEIWGSVRKGLLSLPPVQSDHFLRSDQVRGSVEAFAKSVAPRVAQMDPADRQKAEAQLEDLRFSAEPAISVLRSLAGRPAPPRWVPMAVLAGLAGAAALGGALLRRSRRGELLWLVLTPAALVLAGALYLIGMARSSPEALSYVGLVTGLGDGRTRVQEAYAYYSGPQSRTLDFRCGTQNGVIEDVGQVGAGSVSVSETRLDKEMYLPRQKVETNSTKALYVDGLVTGPRLTPSLTFDRRGLAGTIQNELGGPISKAVVYTNCRTYRLGDLPRGAAPVSVAPEGLLGLVEYVNLHQTLGKLESVAAEPTASPTSGPSASASSSTAMKQALTYLTKGQFTSSDAFDRDDIKRNRLLGSLVTPHMPLRFVGESPVLIGYFSKGLLDPLNEQPLPGGRSGWSVVVWPLRITPPPPGTAVTIPSGFAQVQYGTRGAPAYNSVLRAKDILPGMAHVVRATLPDGIRLRDASAKLRLRASAKNFTMVVSGLAADGKTERVLASFDRPMREMTVSAASVDDLATPEGTYSFVLQFKRIESGGGDDNLVTGNTFEGAEIDLEGTTR